MSKAVVLITMYGSEIDEIITTGEVEILAFDRQIIEEGARYEIQYEMEKMPAPVEPQAHTQEQFDEVITGLRAEAQEALDGGDGDEEEEPAAKTDETVS